MNATFKSFLIIAAKNAVNAVITNATLMATLPGVINLSSSAGLWNILKVTGGTIVAREVTVWGPVLIKWSTTGAVPNGDH